MIEIETLLPRVNTYAPACPEPLAVMHLRDAASELCKRTRCWRFIDVFETFGDTVEVMCVPPFASLFEIDWATFDGHRLEAAAPTPDILQNHDAGQPKFVTQFSPNSVSLVPRGAGKLALSLYLKPADDADMLPASIVAEFGQAIADGAVASLLILPNQSYSNPQMGVFFQNRFDAVLDRHFAYNLRGQQRAAKRTKPSYF